MADMHVDLHVVLMSMHYKSPSVVIHTEHTPVLAHIYEATLLLNSWLIVLQISAYNHSQKYETNDKFYRKVAFLMYTEIVNFRTQS